MGFGAVTLKAMPTVKQLKAKAKAAGLTGYSSWNKDKLIEELDKAGASTGNGSAAGVGIPNEPDKGNVTETDMADAEARSKAAGSEGGQPPKNLGIPTEPERGGVTKADLQVLSGEPIEGAERPKPGDPPSHTGNAGKPTEPDRGGVNKLEKELAGR